VSTGYGAALNTAKVSGSNLLQASWVIIYVKEDVYLMAIPTTR